MSRPSEVYVRPLSPEEQEWVHRLYQQTTHIGLKSRCHIVLLSAQHYSVPQIAALLFSSEDTVARCIHEFNRAGLEGILLGERVGRPAKITEEILKKLLELVESDPRDLQYPFSTWTTELLALALQEQTGLVVSDSCVRRTLQREGYSVQRSVLSVSSPDPDYEQKAARLQELQQRALLAKLICTMKMRSIWPSCQASCAVGASRDSSATSIPLVRIKSSTEPDSSSG